MVKVSVFIGTSLDGYISRSDGGIDWLEKAHKKVTSGEDFGFNSFLNSMDLLVMGRKTFEQVLTFEDWPYKNTKIIVMSSKQIEIPGHLRGKVTVTKESPTQLMERLSNETVKHVYVDGGTVIRGFLASSLVNEITVTIVPILIGDGKSFSGMLPVDISLQHLKTTVFESGFVQIQYGVIN
jgi:dihydrofolate reductase